MIDGPPTASRRTVLAAVPAALGAMVLSGCSAASVTSSTSEQSTTTSTASAVPEPAGGWTTPRTMPEGKGSGAADGVFPRTVVHFAGETTLQKEPQRVVVISTGQADAMLALGIMPVGSTAGDGAETVPNYLYDAHPDQSAALDDVASVGSRFDPDLEAIANLAPDLIVLNLAGKDDIETFVASLGAIAPAVATQGTGLYWKQDFLLLADAVGRLGQAEAWLEEFHTDAAALGEAVTGDPTVSFLRRNGDRTRVFGVASFTGSVAEDSGLARPESQTFTDETSLDISAEQLALADADWVFYGVQGGETSELTSAALWPTLTAVAADQAVPVDDDVFYLNVGPAAARGVLAELERALG